ncbi:LysR family transcriptional regulator [Falsigemmobacter faecalis]|uniref:LysR family transcriptional regulator n=1 Tax=Falsigemmobacter faecalis TaxID=2488730 RepID=A0A3P3D9M6_9RHOB|nr:LysR family transcriptional regulator [Falsigemmobacter faecalis]RRH71060.1 LysR family transcriptional regulator [Falsigemmobacter faecalis]
MLTLKHYELLTTLAEELHFGRAAQRLGVSQPQLTQALKQMEELVGTRLFDRTKRRVELAAAGALLLPDARAVLRHARQAEEVALRAGRGLTGRLSLGYIGTVAYNGVLTKILSHFHTQAAQLDLQLVLMDLDRQFPEVAAGNLDAGIVRLPYPNIPPELDSRVIHREALWIALPTTHPLAGEEKLDLAQFDGADFIATHLPPNTGFAAAMDQACAHAGIKTNIVHRSPQFASIISLVAAGLGVAVVPESLHRVKIPGVVCRALSDVSVTAEIALVWRRDNESPPLQQFLASVSAALPPI